MRFLHALERGLVLRHEAGLEELELLLDRRQRLRLLGVRRAQLLLEARALLLHGLGQLRLRNLALLYGRLHVRLVHAGLPLLEIGEHIREVLVALLTDAVDLAAVLLAHGQHRVLLLLQIQPLLLQPRF